MKKTLNIISLLFISLLSTVSYYYIYLIISAFVLSFVLRLLGPEIITGKSLIIYVLITSVIIPIILSILTGILLYVLHKKKLTKIKNSFALFLLLLFAYCIYKLPELSGPVAIYTN